MENTASHAMENVAASKEVEGQVSMERNNAVGIGSGKTINGLRLVHAARNINRTELRQSRSHNRGELREATTGRPVMVPKIWAVADTAPAARQQPAPVALPQPAKPQPKVELAFYRKYTEAMLRRYLRVSLEVGRVPSIMGRELFRGHVSHYKMEGFEDGVIFSIDVERCLAKLRREDQRIIQRIAIQGYTQEEAAPLLGICLRTCVVKYGEALDRLTEIFLAGRLLEPQKCCQDPEMVENSPSNC